MVKESGEWRVPTGGEDYFSSLLVSKKEESRKQKEQEEEGFDLFIYLGA